MKKLLVNSIIALSLTVIPATVFASSTPQTNNTSQDQHQLPILATVPANGSQSIIPNTPVKIVLDKNSPNFQRFAQQFIKGAYQITFNRNSISSRYDPQSAVITVNASNQNVNTTYTLNLTVKSSMNSNSNNAADNGSFSYSFTTINAPKWTLPNYIDSNWSLINDIGSVGLSPWGQLSGWTDYNAHWMWSQPNAVLDAPSGTTYNRLDFTLVKDTTIYISAAGDNNIKLYVDGQTLLSNDNMGAWLAHFHSQDINLSAGKHTLAAECTNQTGQYPNPAGFIVSIADNAGNKLFDNPSNAHWVTNGYNQPN